MNADIKAIVDRHGRSVFSASAEQWDRISSRHDGDIDVVLVDGKWAGRSAVAAAKIIRWARS